MEVSTPMEDHANHQDTVEKSSDGFMAVDIGALSSETEQTMESRSSSRKGSQRNRAENAGGVCEDETELTHVHVAQPGGPCEAFRVATPKVGGSGKCNRRQSRRRSNWLCMLGPRRVLFVFAALSSMGTLILLYFTLSIAKPTANKNG